MSSRAAFGAGTSAFIAALNFKIVMRLTDIAMYQLRDTMKYMNQEYIAYEGEEFTVEWYYSANGKSPVLDYYKALDAAERIKVLRLFKRIGESGEIRDKTKFNSEGDKIYAFKPQPYRFLCFFFDGEKIIVTNAFHKKQPKLPKNEKERALSIKTDYESRVKRGDYYD